MNDFSGEHGERKFPNPYVLGFSTSIGSGGKLQVNKFDSLRSPFQGKEVPKEREPLVDILENRNEVMIKAELQGITKEDAKLDVTESTIKIVVNAPERNYYRKLYLQAKVQQGFLRKSYKNDFLEIRLKKISGRPISTKKHLSPSD